MKPLFDWKYVLAILVALAGVGVPVLLWQVDQARSLRLDVISQTTISPVASSALSGLKLTLDGVEVSEARLTVMELINSGKRPILAGDFEAPLEITSKAPSEIVRIDLGEVSPTSLKPIFGLKDGQISMQPFLMNSSDRARISIITSGGAPKFSVRGRIAGISDVDFNAEVLSEQPSIFWIRTVTGFLLFAAYLSSLFAFLDSWKEKRLDLRLLALTLTCASANTFLTINLTTYFGWTIWQLMATEFAIGLLLSWIASFLRPRKKLLGVLSV